MRPLLPGPRSPRRGVTLVEMLVSVALLVLMMSIIATIFTAATGAVSAARVYQELDGNLRQIDSTIRTDLFGITARLTPPLDPKQNLGYFEYGENQFADLQGEDTDDYLRFTTKAPEGQPFTGRLFVPPTIPFASMSAAQLSAYQATQPITITSQYAEVIYFLRNGNLYRRVLLIVPERRNSLQVGSAAGTVGGYSYSGFGSTFNVSWQGLNDISAHPDPLGSINPIPNTLGNLTNRENRAFYPRFSNDYWNTAGATLQPDGMTDDTNADGVADYYPTLYPLVKNAKNQNGALLLNTNANFTRMGGSTKDTMAFPFLFPGAFSVPDDSTNAHGQIHGLLPDGVQVTPGTSTPSVLPYGYYYPFAVGVHQYNTALPTTLAGSPLPARPNHAPLEVGDNLAVPAATQLQSWWGFPTWRETMSPSWVDPNWALNNSGSGQSQATGLSWTTITGLPPLNALLDFQPFNDGAGSTTFSTPGTVFRDDLLLTGVRSFDVKAFESMYPGYVDLGYGDFESGFSAANCPIFPNVAPILQTFAHEGRIPPLQEDFRFDPQALRYNIASNVGDDQAGVTRLRRVFDTWSTDYTTAPAMGISGGGVIGPTTGSLPYYPSYPPPYPIPLRGIRIQIRVVDPRNERIKTLTIVQDFSDKL